MWQRLEETKQKQGVGAARALEEPQPLFYSTRFAKKLRVEYLKTQMLFFTYLGEIYKA